MSKSVGLEIHTCGVRAVEVSGRGRKIRVGRFMERAVSIRGGAPDPEELHEALTEIFKVGKFSKHHVVASVEAHDTVVREIPVPFKADDHIRKVVKYEAEHHLHDCDADDVIVQYTRVAESGEGTNLLVFASRKQDISRRVEATRAVGVEPLMMDLDALAYYNAVRASGELDDSAACVLMKIGHRSTELVFVIDGAVRALRSVRMGVDSIAQGLARDMDIGIEEAGHKIHELTGVDEDEGDLLLPMDRLDDTPETEKSHAELERDLFQQKRDEFLARLKREFVRSSAGLRGGTQPERVLATGAGLAVPGLLDMLGQRIGIAVEAFRPTESFSCKLNGISPERFNAGGAVALGLALKGIGTDPLGIDFRQEELKVANKFELLKNTLAVTVTLLFIGLLAFSFYCVIKKRNLQEERFEPMLTKAYQAFSEVTRKYNALSEDIVSPREHVNPNTVEGAGDRDRAIQRFVSTLATMRRKLHKRIGGTQGIEPITSALKKWNDVFKVVGESHEQIQYVDFETIDIRQRQVTLAVIIQDAAAAEHLAEQLKKLPVLSELELEPYGADPYGNHVKVRYHFTEKRRRGRR
jgi:type IV pilus assembly protein PilM